MFRVIDSIYHLEPLATGGEGKTLIQAHHLQGRSIITRSHDCGCQLQGIGSTKCVNAERTLRG